MKPVISFVPSRVRGTPPSGRRFLAWSLPLLCAFLSARESLFLRSDFSLPADVVPVDPSRPSSDDAFRPDGAHPSGIRFFYEGGDANGRSARIEEAPEAAGRSGRALRFRIEKAEAKHGSKARIQADLTGLPKGVTSFRQSVRLFLPESMALLKTYPGEIRWLTIMEVWNDAPLKPRPFRVTVGLHKPVKGPGPLYFHVDAQDIDQTVAEKPKFITLWSNLSRDVEVPFGEWIGLETRVVEGNASTGRFVMDLTSGGARRNLFTISNFTHHSKEPSPDGFSPWNPVKLYTSKPLVDFMREKGSPLEAWWDDLEIFIDRDGS